VIKAVKGSRRQRAFRNGLLTLEFFGAQLLGKFFDDAVKDSRLRYSPMQSVEKPKTPNEKKGRALRPQEIQSLLANAEDETTRLILLMGILTGMRRGELFGLWWEDIDWRHDVVRVRRALYWRHVKYVRPAEGEPYTFVEPKSKTSIREIDLSPALKTKLRQYSLAGATTEQIVSGSPRTGLVFSTAKRKPMDPNAFLRRHFARAVAAAELGELRFHDLRHTFGSMKIEDIC